MPIEPKTTDKQVNEALEQTGSVKAAAELLGVTYGGFKGRWRRMRATGRLTPKAIEALLENPMHTRYAEVPPASLEGVRHAMRLRGDTASDNSILRQAHDRITDLEEQLDRTTQIKDIAAKAELRPLTIKDYQKNESVMVAVASDWHYGETVRGSTVQGLNEFNPTIANKRIEEFFQKVVILTDMIRSRSKIDTLILALLGDLMTGMIHEDQMESNSMHPTREVTSLYGLIVPGIEFLLNHGNFKDILIPCCVGNHGRTTREKRFSTRIDTSFEWLLYSMIEQHFKNKGEKRVRFQLPTGYFNRVDLPDGDWFRFHHGDNIRYQGGIGGMAVPLNKAISAWNRTRGVTGGYRKAHGITPPVMDICGHLHQLEFGGDYIVNGSLVGYTAYGEGVKASFESPKQCLFAWHPVHGRTFACPITFEE